MVDGVFSLSSNAHGTVHCGPVAQQSAARDAYAHSAVSEFVAGPENELVRIAFQSVLESPSRYNPIVFFGGNGVGKTLLSKLIADVACHDKRASAARVVCTNGADFARDYANALEADSLLDFREKHRSAELLIVDDLHQVAKKKAAQIELTATIDELLANDTQFVATLPTAPMEDRNLASNLASRLSAGLSVPMAMPGPDAKRVIVQRLCRLHDLSLTDDAVELLSNGLPRDQFALANFPQLNSALMRIRTLVADASQPINSEQVLKALSDDDNPRKPTVPLIAKQVARYFHVKSSELRGATRQQRVVRARGVAMLLARKFTDTSLERIGRHFGDRDHTTVMHACRKTEALIESDPVIRQSIRELSRILGAPK